MPSVHWLRGLTDGAVYLGTFAFAAFIVASLSFALHFGLRKTILRFSAPATLGLMLCLAIFDVREMPIHVTNFTTALSYDGFDFTSNWSILLVSALLVEHRYAWSHHPGRDIATALVLVILLSALLSASHRLLPSDLVVQPGRFVPRPGNLVPAVFFLLAALLFQRRLKNTSGPFDFSLYFAAAINFWCSIAASESAHQLDTTFALAVALQFSSYAVLLGGALLDIVRLFKDVRRLAVSDSVTGLANYRHLLDSLELEIQRTGRTGRGFAILLFDLDGLKKINDQFGHQVGTRALCRVAQVLRSQSRTIDTSARHGGDEFALVLPETTGQGAQEVLSRVRDHIAHDGEDPILSVSAGFAIYPRDGQTAESLLEAADRSLYHMKGQHRKNPPILKQAAV
jgi:diguanylate cyclase (GGDEF)-like protein